MKVEKDLLYSEDHEWVKVEGDVVYLGLSDFAQDSLGDIVYVELPDVDDEVEKDEAFSAVESVKAASDIYSPVSGKIVEINEDLEDDPAILNADPYANWIVKVELSDKSELDELMSGEDYEKFIEEE